MSGKTLQVQVVLGASAKDPATASLGAVFDGVSDPALAKTLGLDKPGGAFVLETMPGSPAAQSGLRFGDVIQARDGTPVVDHEQFAQTIRSLAPGTSLALTVFRVGDDGSAYLQALRKNGEAGSVPAMNLLGRLYSKGVGVARDESEAVNWYKRAAQAGDTTGMVQFGEALATGSGTIKDGQEAARWVRKAADAGNTRAHYIMGLMYLVGDVVPKDPLEALSSLKKAAEQNHTPAMVALGSMFAGSGGLATDYLQAVQWYKRAADAGDPNGMRNLGLMYYHGRGVAKDDAAAMLWYRKAVQLNDLTAMHNLAVMHEEGRGTARDPAAAAELIYQALEGRYPFSYQQMVQHNRGWSRDFRKALQQKLAQGGYYTGAIDGNFKQSTLDAINALVRRPR
ncbi:MAG: PDZ domain-containing protein [Hyphomicrobium sp.]